MAKPSFTTVIRQDGDWWIGWIEEIPGVNSQGATREELISNLREALSEALEMNREDARSAAGTPFEDEHLIVQDWHKKEANRRWAELEANPDIALTREELCKRVDEKNG